jgi:hypothetical protein
MLNNLRKLEKRIFKEVSSTYKRSMYKKIDLNSWMTGVVGDREV